MGKGRIQYKVRFVGLGQGQIGTIPDKEDGRFFHVFKSGEEVEVPDALAKEIQAASAAWLSRGFELLEVK